MVKEALLVSIAIVALTVAWMVVLSGGRSVAPPAAESTAKNPDVPTASERRVAHTTTGADDAQSEERSKPVTRAAWSTADRDAWNPQTVPPIDPKLEDTVLMAVNPNLWSMEAGDAISIAVPQTSATFTTVIDRIEPGMGGSHSYIGRLAQGELPYSFVITVGGHSVFAHLGTPEGIFEMAGNRELAWLTPKASFDRLLDYSQPDFFLLNDERSHLLRGKVR